MVRLIPPPPTPANAPNPKLLVAPPNGSAARMPQASRRRIDDSGLNRVLAGFRLLRHDANGIVDDLKKAPAHLELPSVAAANAQRPGAEERHERSMPRQNTQFPIEGRSDDRVGR